ncbi:hypothetical protein GIB67_019826 [Kingdonia uniflora]|uniref:Uncharacterized protein n=1 Tax=Kingdonia uniflora TaxID=39325 RepID=A0A7J7MKJ2_9MAGN|nr:hypothetical protein GIB67_019826 [Kingdonia uniflora]
MNEVQLYIIVHFGGDIVRPKIRSIKCTKLTSLRAHSSYEDFVTLLEETSEIRHEDWLSTTKDTGSGRGLSTTKAGRPLLHNLFPDPEPEYRGYPETNARGLDPQRFGPFVDGENDSFKTIRTDVPPINEPSIPQSNIHLSNEPAIHLSNKPVLTNVPPSNEPMLTNAPLSIKPEPIIGQTETSAEFQFEPQPEQVKDLLDFRFKSAAYTEDPYDFSKKFNIGNLYRDRIELKNHIRAYAVANKFNLEYVLSNEYKIVEQKLRKDPNYKAFEIIDDMQIHHNIDITYNLAWRAKEKAHTEMRGSFQHAYQLLTSYFAEVRYGVAYTNHVESWNNVILKVRDLPIHVFIEELSRICSEISYTYRKEAEKSQACLTSWATDHCESKKFIADSLTCRVRTSRHHFQITSYGRDDYVNIEDGTCSCCWW